MYSSLPALPVVFTSEGGQRRSTFGKMGGDPILVPSRGLRVQRTNCPSFPKFLATHVVRQSLCIPLLGRFLPPSSRINYRDKQTLFWYSTTGAMLGMLSYHGDDFRGPKSSTRPVRRRLRATGASEEAEGGDAHATRLATLPGSCEPAFASCFSRTTGSIFEHVHPADASGPISFGRSRDICLL